MVGMDVPVCDIFLGGWGCLKLGARGLEHSMGRWRQRAVSQLFKIYVLKDV